MAAFTGFEAGAPALIAVGIPGFQAAVAQAPLVAFVIPFVIAFVMERMGGHAMVQNLMAAGLGTSLISRWIRRLLYSALMQAQMGRRAAVRP